MDSLLQYDDDDDDVYSSESKETQGNGRSEAEACNEEVGLKLCETVLRDEKKSDEDYCVDFFNLQSVSSDKSDFSKSSFSIKADLDPYLEWNSTGTDTTSYETLWKESKICCSWNDFESTPHNATENMQRVQKNVNQRDDDDIVVVPYKSKRQKILESNVTEKSNSVNVSGSSSHLLPRKEATTLGKSFFVIHSKIQPHLFVNDIVQSRVPQKVLKQLNGHLGAVNRVKWCIRQYSHLLLSVSMDQSAKIWNVFSTSSDPCVRTISCHWKAVKDGDWSATGRQIVTCGFDRTARVSDIEKGTELCKCKFDDFVTCVKYHPVQENLFVAGSLNLLKCWDVRCSSKPVRSYSFKDKIGQVHDLCFLDNGNTFLSCGSLVARDSADRNIMVWDFLSGAVISNQIYHERYICTRFCKHPHSAQFLAQTHGDYVVQFDASPPYRMNKCKRYEGHKVFGYDIGCDISPDGRFVATGSTMGEMFFYDYRSAKVLSKLSIADTSDIILNVVWHPVLYSTVALGSWSGIVEIWQ